jgi:heat shock protein HslJ
MARTRSNLLAALAVTAMIGLAACTPAGPASDAADALVGPTWGLTESTVPALAGGDIDPVRYTIEFVDGTFDAEVDCNRVSGTYAWSSDGLLTITPGPSTMAECPEGSLAGDYLAALQATTAFEATDGRLVLTTGDGTLTFE